MLAKYILAALSAVFLALALARISFNGDRTPPQTRTWLLIGVIFGIVSAYLFSQG